LTNDNKLYYISGQSHAYDWSAIYKLDGNTGNRIVVNNWRTHWLKVGGEWKGTPSTSYIGGVQALDYSGIVLKTWGRCDLRSFGHKTEYKSYHKLMEMEEQKWENGP